MHLNRGDAGLQALFAAFWSALSRGGLLLMEPQPWSSYKAAASKIRRDQAPPGSYFHRQARLLNHRLCLACLLGHPFSKWQAWHKCHTRPSAS